MSKPGAQTESVPPLNLPDTTSSTVIRPVEVRVVTACVITSQYPFLALQHENELLTCRERDEIGDFKKSSKGHRHKKTPQAPEQHNPTPSSSHPSSSRPAEYNEHTHGLRWDRAGDHRVGPDTIKNSGAVPPFYILPCSGRVYCNVQFEQLNKLDKVTYTWLSPDGRRFHRKRLLKVLGQRRTWSWNFIDVAKPNARELHGAWTVHVSVNSTLVAKSSFVLLRDYIQVDEGPLPIIISCPHAGIGSMPDCLRRAPTQGSTEVAVDLIELAVNLRSHLAVLFGVPPTLVTCTMHRRQLDVDQPEKDAYNDPKCAPYYHRYYEAVLATIQRVMKIQRRQPIVLHLVAHTQRGQMMYVSTEGGRTLEEMRRRVQRTEGDVDARFLDQSLISRMLGCRWLVSPRRDVCPEEEEWGVREVVRRFGLEHTWRVNCMHVTVPAELCGGFGLRPFCHDLAESLAHMYHTYLHHAYVDTLPE